MWKKYLYADFNKETGASAILLFHPSKVLRSISKTFVLLSSGKGILSFLDSDEKVLFRNLEKTHILVHLSDEEVNLAAVCLMVRWRMTMHYLQCSGQVGSKTCYPFEKWKHEALQSASTIDSAWLTITSKSGIIPWMWYILYCRHTMDVYVEMVIRYKRCM